MTDDESLRITPREQAGDERYGEALTYDFAKFLTTTSLIMLGGMLTLGGAVRDGALDQRYLLICSGAIALAGILAFNAASSLTQARAKGKGSPRLLLPSLKASTFLMGLAIPVFIVMWMETLT